MQSDFAFLNQFPDGHSERLDAVDPRLAALNDLAARSEWKEIEERAAALFEARVYDIRPLSYYVYACFHRGGLPTMASVLEATGRIVGERFDAIGPSKKREHHFDKRLVWLFEKMLETIEYNEHKRTPDWTAWHEGLGPDALDRAIAAGDALAAALAERASFEESPRPLGALIAWLRRHGEVLAAPPKSQATSSKPAPASPDPPVTAAPADGDGAALEALRRRVQLVVSHEFTILTSKLQLFEALVTKGDLLKAAVVADDLNRAIETFDPRDYFPEHFARFGALFAKHVLPLTEKIEARDSPQWKALVQHYRVDPKSFVDGG